MTGQLSPVVNASARKPAVSATTTLLEMVMVRRSLAAANDISAGNTSRTSAPLIIAWLPRTRPATELATSEGAGRAEPRRNCEVLPAAAGRRASRGGRRVELGLDEVDRVV